jgi:hypothetical protein
MLQLRLPQPGEPIVYHNKEEFSFCRTSEDATNAEWYRVFKSLPFRIKPSQLLVAFDWRQDGVIKQKLVVKLSRGGRVVATVLLVEGSAANVWSRSDISVPAESEVQQCADAGDCIELWRCASNEFGKNLHLRKIELTVFPDVDSK